MKKAFYVFCTMILGVLISLIILTLLERAFLVQIISEGQEIPAQINFLGLSFFLPMIVVYLFFVLGAIGGVMMGFRWWQLVYVDKKYFRRFGSASIGSGKTHRVIKKLKPTKRTITVQVSKRKKAAPKTKAVATKKPIKKTSKPIKVKAKAKKK